MKKIGFIALALLLVLSGLGIGFSMWSQTITVNGTVQTGYVALQLSTPTGTWVYKQENPSATDFGAIIIQKGPSPTTSPEAGAVLIGSADVATGALAQSWPRTCAAGATGVTANFAFSNIFPIFGPTGAPMNWDINFTVTNNGTIPVKFEMGAISLLDGSGNPIPASDLVLSYTGTALEGTQIEPTGTAEVRISIQVVDVNASQNLSGNLSATITAVQWNEYTAPK